MRQIRHERVYKMCSTSLQMLSRAQREAEALVDQSLADDLYRLTLELTAIVRAAEQKRYRSPLALRP